MKKITRLWQFLLIQLRPQKRQSFSLERTLDNNGIGAWFSRITGRVYRLFINLAERRRVRRFKLEGELQEHRILREIVSHSRRLLIYLLLASLLIVGLDALGGQFVGWLKQITFLETYFNLPTKADLSTGLQVYIGSVSAVLGLIFALYAVGFQLSTDRYSTNVTTFLNREKVSTYLFQFLVFTDLFSIVVYLKLVMFGDLPLVSFGVATVFVALCFLGIIVFKNHYVEFIKPATIFNRLYGTIWDDIKFVSDKRSFKRKSWSLASRARIHAKEHLRIVESLYRDLVRRSTNQTENWNDAGLTPLVMGRIMRGYTDKKRLIDSNKAWWAAQRFEKVKANNLTMYSMKLQHEVKGMGPLFIPSADSNWFEDRAFSFFDELSEDVSKDESGQFFAAVSEGYRTLLVGDKEKQIDSAPKTVPGAWQNQEFGIFEKGLNGFLALWGKIDICKSKAATNYLNDYFVIVSEVIEPWSSKKALHVAENFYRGDQLNRNKDFLDDDLPAFFRGVLQDYWGRLEMEQIAEGRLLTPKEHLLNEIEQQFNNKYTELREHYLNLFFDDTTKIIQKMIDCENYNNALQFVKVQMEWISHLLYTKEVDLAERFAPKVKANVRYLLLNDRDDIEEEEMLEQAEKGYFVALQEEAKEAFALYAHALVIVRFRRAYDETDREKILREIRLPVIWGSHAFALSEFRQDNYWVKMFVRELERTFQPGFLPQLIVLTADRQLRNIGWETTRYLPWERAMVGKIQRELNPIPAHGAGEIGYGMTYDHPSKLIRGLAEFDMLFDDQAAQGFVEWVQKREAIQQLLALLTQKWNRP